MIFLLFLLAVPLQKLSAQITISSRNNNLGSVIEKISSQSNYHFFYNDDLSKRTVNYVDLKDVSITEAMEKLLSGKDITYKIVDNIIYLSPKKISPEEKAPEKKGIIISGRVTDSNGSPLQGVTVLLQGTAEAVTTDEKGTYSIKAETDSPTLIFSYIGYKDVFVETGKRRVINVVLKENSINLDELVVVGYGVQKKVNLTGSVKSVSSNDLSRTSTAMVSTALQGAVPGLTAIESSGQPGASASLQIRGKGSLNSSTSPLVLIDGVEGDMNRIDINSIQSISVLKDAASASIYGSRASNGVILITTKRGKNGEIKINYSGYVGINTPTCLPKPVSAVQYMEAVNTACDNANQDHIYSDKTIDIYKNGGADNNNYYNTDWKKEVIKNNAMLQHHSVSISGGTDKLKYFADAGYYSQNGQIKNNSFTCTNFRVNTDAKLRKWLKIGTDINLRQAKAKRPVMDTPVNIIGYALTMTPLMSGRNSDGTYGYGINGINPIAMAEVGGIRNDTSPEASLKESVTITPLKGLNILGSYSYKDLQSITDAFVYPYDTYEMGVFKMSYPSSGSSKAEQRGRSITKQFNLQSSYEREIAKHYFKVLAGMQTEELNYKYIGAGRKNFSYRDYSELSNGDISTMSNSSSRYDWAMMSYLYRLNYSYGGKYLLEVNGRYDGTSRFMKGQRWGFFPSASAGWRVSQEKFFEPLKKYISNMKLRVSYGILGNQSISSYYPYAATISSSSSYSYWFDKKQTTGVAQTQLANEMISWEKSKQFDAGLDVGMFNQKLSLEFDYYVRKIYDMLQKFAVPSFVGMSSPWKNAGSMRNKGWEFSVSWKDSINDFSYYINANISDVKNKVTDLYGNEYIGYSTITREGDPYGSYYGYVSDGYFQSQEEIDNAKCVYGGNKANIKPGYIKYKDINHDGFINSKDRKIIGNPTPRYCYSFTLGGEWKNFDLSLFFQGIGKKDIFYAGAGARPLISYCTLYENQLDSWSETNRNAKYPIMLVDATGSNQNNIVSDFWVKSGSYLRLKNLVVGYTLPKKLVNKLTISNVRLYLSCRNLFTISNCLQGYDPESSISSGNFYPIMKTYNFGINIDF
ncbi:MAG: TonB-dependent receptor [Bacteroidales bacterium]|jgi:TonB-linked SusC/RagA family outer membrane protein|nr:TonB-dependent receptor [Bacteroidales bacterium]